MAKSMSAQRLAAECVVGLIRTDSMLVPRLDRIFRRHGLTGPGFNVLTILAGAGTALPPNVIGERRLVTRGTVTSLLGTLERQGFVARRPHPEDGRSVLVDITRRGRAARDAAWRELGPAQVAMLGALTTDEKETLIRLLSKLQANLTGDAGEGRDRR